MDEEGEEESDAGEEGEDYNQQNKKSSENLPPVVSSAAAKGKSQTEEKDSHSKVSTASTNEEPNLYLIKIGSGQTGSSGGDSKPTKKKVTVKVKKTAKMVRPSANNDGLDEETKSIIDNQLDQLVIHKPPQLTNQIQGKDRSLKEAFLRRPPNNIISVMYGPVPGRAPTVFFNYPPFLQIQRPYRQDRI